MRQLKNGKQLKEEDRENEIRLKSFLILHLKGYLLTELGMNMLQKK